MNMPRIVTMKVYLINDEPCFYGYDEDPEVYSLCDKERIRKGKFLDKLPHREVMPADLPELIVHDQMTDDDFEHLRSKGLLAKEIEVLFDKIKHLKGTLSQAAEMTKSMENPALPPQEPQIEEAVLEMSDEPVAGVNVAQQILDLCRGPSRQEIETEKIVRKILVEMLSPMLKPKQTVLEQSMPVHMMD